MLVNHRIIGLDIFECLGLGELKTHGFAVVWVVNNFRASNIGRCATVSSTVVGSLWDSIERVKRRWRAPSMCRRSDSGRHRIVRRVLEPVMLA